jgi:hypothetical protein
MAHRLVVRPEDPRTTEEPTMAKTLVLDELTTLIEKAKQRSRLGGNTCVYVCLPGTEYVPLTGTTLDQDGQGAVFLLKTGRRPRTERKRKPQ